jgi:NAD(P)-dependent dehydrogenase (short-subunit alcohol dehydrogenase family)
MHMASVNKRTAGWEGCNPTRQTEDASGYGSQAKTERASGCLTNKELQTDGFKVNALAPGARRTNLNSSGRGDDPAEAGAAVVELVQIPDDGPTGRLFSYDGTIAPW